MIIRNAYEVTSKDVGKYAWSELRRFHNVKAIQQAHIELLKIPTDFRHFAAKQAEQIKFCLLQAREYAAAAENVSLATKPLLLYYSCMSLAIAEILLKQSGDSSLDRARKKHNHHGLVLSISEDVIRKNDDFTSVAAAISARPMILEHPGRPPERVGTFELWHQSARGLPGVGKYTEYHHNGGNTSYYRSLIVAEDVRLPLIQRKGINLLDTMSRVPGMNDALRSYVQSEVFIRANISADCHINDSRRLLTLIIHPTSRDNFDILLNKIMVKQPNVNDFEVMEFAGGGSLTIDLTTSSYHNMITRDCCNLGRDEVLIWRDEKPQNEFAYIYLTLYMLGNFARYYPDLWMKAVEQNHPIAIVSERFIELAESRMPLCALSEMSRLYYFSK